MTLPYNDKSNVQCNCWAKHSYDPCPAHDVCDCGFTKPRANSMCSDCFNNFEIINEVAPMLKEVGVTGFIRKQLLDLLDD